MGVRRVVTGHTTEGKSVVVSDEEVAAMPIGGQGSTTTLLWGRDDPARFPDDGTEPRISAAFPPVGGCTLAVWELASDGDDFDEFIGRALLPWADPGEPGMHRTPTLDYDVVLDGTIGLELDDGAEVILGPGDVVVQNGTRHRWHNRGNSVGRVLSVCVGANHRIKGGARV